MTRDRTHLFDWLLQAAAIMAVIFVFHAGTAQGADSTVSERDVIAEALRAGISPSLALAVAQSDADRWRTRTGVRAAVASLQDALAWHPARLDRALARYSGRADGARFAAAIRVLARQFDADARAAAQDLAARPVPRRSIFDDFDSTIAQRARRAGRTLDDFPNLPRRG